MPLCKLERIRLGLLLLGWSCLWLLGCFGFAVVLTLFGPRWASAFLGFLGWRAESIGRVFAGVVIGAVFLVAY